MGNRTRTLTEAKELKLEFFSHSGNYKMGIVQPYEGMMRVRIFGSGV